MGISLSRVWNRLFGSRQTRLLLLGLDSAGKTTILYRFKLGDVTATTPTIGFNVERVEYQNTSFVVWDVGGQEKIRPLWRIYYENVDGIIFVVDSTDRKRILEAAAELMHLLNDELLKNTMFVIFANKQDVRGCMSVDEVINKMRLTSIEGKKWFVVGTSAVTGEGIFEGLNWIAQRVNDK